MMSDRAARMVVLCEDAQHRTFAYRLLKDLGFPRRRIRVEQAPAGQGAAEQFVRETYPDEVRLHRRKSARMNIGLIAIVDADTVSVQQRVQDFDKELDRRDLGRRRPDERICILIPKRNIETWIYALFGKKVNETDSYPKLDREAACQPAVNTLAQYVKGGCPNTVIQSLRRGCRELSSRLPK